jgi:hypothetical protein
MSIARWAAASSMVSAFSTSTSIVAVVPRLREREDPLAVLR